MNEMLEQKSWKGSIYEDIYTGQGGEEEDNGSVVILIGNELPENLLKKTKMRRFWEISEAVSPLNLQLKSSVSAFSMTGLYYLK